MDVILLKYGRNGSVRRAGRQTLPPADARRDLRRLQAALPMPTELPETLDERYLQITRDVLVSPTRGPLRQLEVGIELSASGVDLVLAEQLIELDFGRWTLPAPSGRDLLVRWTQPTEIAGVAVRPGQVTAVDHDPASVLPELRSLGLFPWDELPIADLGPLTVRGSDVEWIRLVVALDAPWQHLEIGAFLPGMRVDLSYRDYRLGLPTGVVERAYFAGRSTRPPFAVLGPVGEQIL